MRSRYLMIPAVVALAGCAHGAPNMRAPSVPPPTWEALRTAIAGRAEREAPGVVAVEVVDLATGARLGVNDTVAMHAASTMKLPVLIELYRQAEAGRFSLDDSIPVRNEFRSIADGSTYTLDANDDSDSTVYALVGRRAPIRELARRMIVRSSNLATNLLIDLVTPDSVRRTMHAIGADGMHVLRGVEDNPAFRAGMNNTTTADALARAFEAVARCTVTSRRACNEMVGILSAQEFNEMIPAGLPPGTRVAHKTGSITGIQHDGGIVYPPGRAPYVLVVLTRGVADGARAQHAGADVSRLVWESLAGRG